jgi:hypothetical protein
LLKTNVYLLGWKNTNPTYLTESKFKTGFEKPRPFDELRERGAAISAKNQIGDKDKYSIKKVGLSPQIM